MNEFQELTTNQMAEATGGQEILGIIDTINAVTAFLFGNPILPSSEQILTAMFGQRLGTFLAFIL